MDAILQMLSRGVDQLLGRASGPLHLRLLTMPLVVTFLAVRTGLRDAREGRTMFFWSILTNPTERPRLLRSAFKDLGRVLVMALVLDAAYQVVVLRAFYIVQALIVATVCAIVPYFLMRGPISVLMCCLYRNRPVPASASTAKAEPVGQERKAVEQSPQNLIGRKG
jgi:hypothetical protein